MDSKERGEEPQATSPIEVLILPSGEVPVLVEESFREKEQMGEFVPYPSHRILVGPDVEGEAYDRTLLHESIHAIDDCYGLGLSEAKTRCLETALFAFIRANPELILRILS